MTPPNLDETLQRLSDEHPELDIRVRKRPKPGSRVTVWLVGTVIAGLLPIGVTAVQAIDNNNSPSFYELLGRGDLLLISIVMLTRLTPLGWVGAQAGLPENDHRVSGPLPRR
jgi:hypothetical protein